MDPNAALDQLRAMVREVLTAGPHDVTATQFAETFDALDAWFGKGGFLPEEWRKYQPVLVQVTQHPVGHTGRCFVVCAPDCERAL